LFPLTSEPLCELFTISKVRSGHQKFEQCPQLRQIVLQRGTSKKQPAERAEHQQNIPSLRLEILDHMRLIQYHVVPRLSLEDMRIAAGKRVRRDADVEVELVVPTLT
jgi:hypothetical protein